jgi:ubiquinone/menaquinone biosynthesis C-methylase UbiE
MATALDKLVFDAAQTARIGWFAGQKLLARRLSRPVKLPERLRNRQMPASRRLSADLRQLLERDWRNVAAGLYAMPEDWRGNPLAELRRAVDFFADLEAVEQRRHGEGADRILIDAPSEHYPRYYLQNFHFQSEGYLSAASAERYDHQVEVLFGGGAAAMRRQALVPLRDALMRHCSNGAVAKLLDVGCGTGSFLREVKRNYPRLRVTGLDLSGPYLGVAARRLADWSRVELVEAAAERMPFHNASFDVVTSVYLFHELPPRIRRAVAAEIQRVLKPNGTFILVDSLQTGDVPEYDGLLDFFPIAFHEPYYTSYLRENLEDLFSPLLTRQTTALAYLSKVQAFRSPA